MLSQEYNNLSQPMKAQYTELGRIATRKRKRGGCKKGESAFGTRSKQKEFKRAEQRLRDALVEKHKG